MNQFNILIISVLLINYSLTIKAETKTPNNLLNCFFEINQDLQNFDLVTSKTSQGLDNLPFTVNAQNKLVLRYKNPSLSLLPQTNTQKFDKIISSKYQVEYDRQNKKLTISLTKGDQLEYSATGTNRSETNEYKIEYNLNDLCSKKVTIKQNKNPRELVYSSAVCQKITVLYKQSVMIKTGKRFNLGRIPVKCSSEDECVQKTISTYKRDMPIQENRKTPYFAFRDITNHDRVSINPLPKQATYRNQSTPTKKLARKIEKSCRTMGGLYTPKHTKIEHELTHYLMGQQYIPGGSEIETITTDSPNSPWSSDQ